MGRKASVVGTGARGDSNETLEGAGIVGVLVISAHCRPPMYGDALEGNVNTAVSNYYTLSITSTWSSIASRVQF